MTYRPVTYISHFIGHGTKSCIFYVAGVFQATLETQPKLQYLNANQKVLPIFTGPSKTALWLWWKCLTGPEELSGPKSAPPVKAAPFCQPYITRSSGSAATQQWE